MLKVHKDKNSGEPSGLYPDTIKVKLPFYKNDDDEEGKFKFDLYDRATKEQIEQNDIIQSLEKGSKVRFLIECQGVWFANGKFGISWKAVQASIKRPEKIQGYSFVDDDDDEYTEIDREVENTYVEDDE
jgi:hypothetical protein